MQCVYQFLPLPVDILKLTFTQTNQLLQVTLHSFNNIYTITIAAVYGKEEVDMKPFKQYQMKNALQGWFRVSKTNTRIWQQILEMKKKANTMFKYAFGIPDDL